VTKAATKAAAEPKKKDDEEDDAPPYVSFICNYIVYLLISLLNQEKEGKQNACGSQNMQPAEHACSPSCIATR
jgi:hypothetical protein